MAVCRDMGNEEKAAPGFFARLGLAWKVLINKVVAAELLQLIAKPSTKEPKAVPPEKMHASGLFLLSVLQQEGRLIDFLQQDVATFSDEEVGAAARVVHAGCCKALQRLISTSPILREAEGSIISVPAGFDANRIQLTGNVTGQAPFKGTLKHHGWAATEIKFPTLNESVDYRVIAPAEVEL